MSLTPAQNFADQRATVYIRKGIVDMYQSTTPADHVRPEHDRELDELREAADRRLGDVWCSKCDQPAVAEIALTLGETRAYCARCIARISIQPGAAGIVAAALRGEDDPSIQHEAVEL